MAQFLRRTHDLFLASMRENPEHANFQEKQRRAVRLRGVSGIRSDYEYVRPHLIPFLSMPVRGYLITVPLSQTEVLHISFEMVLVLIDYADPADWLRVGIAFVGAFPLFTMLLGWFVGGMFRAD